jgi:hypothetical protein
MTGRRPRAFLSLDREFALCRPCLLAVFLRVPIERRLNLCVMRNSLNGFRFDFRFVHQPVA